MNTMEFVLTFLVPLHVTAAKDLLGLDAKQTSTSVNLIRVKMKEAVLMILGRSVVSACQVNLKVYDQNIVFKIKFCNKIICNA